MRHQGEPGIYYAGCKWLTRRQTRGGRWRSLGYLILWPGMDAHSFLNEKTRVPVTHTREWMLAIAKTALGAALIWGVARLVPPQYPLVSGWTGMAGLILLLHFGTFHVLSLAWRRAGVNAQPIMRSPVLAT